jgi:hypothetical protein
MTIKPTMIYKITIERLKSDWPPVEIVLTASQMKHIDEILAWGSSGLEQANKRKYSVAVAEFLDTFELVTTVSS